MDENTNPYLKHIQDIAVSSEEIAYFYTVNKEVYLRLPVLQMYNYVMMRGDVE